MRKRSNDKQPFCLICHKELEGRTVGFCSECIDDDPEKIIFSCHSCGRTEELSRKELAIFVDKVGNGKERYLQKGIVITVAKCLECDDIEEDTDYTAHFWKIRT